MILTATAKSSKIFYLFFVLIGIQTLLTIKSINCAAPQVYYANVGDSARMQCTNGGGSYACYSTYTFQNKIYPMAILNNSLKYQLTMGTIEIRNVQSTDAGFYACSSDCYQMKSDAISYYLQPMSSGQPVDVSQNWLPIPPFQFDPNPNKLIYYVVVDSEYSNETSSGLTIGEIVGLVIGLVIALIIIIGAILFWIFLKRRNQKKREKIISSAKRNEKDATSVDYSTIEREYGNDGTGTGSTKQILPDKDGEKWFLANNKKETSNDINTKNIRGPNIYKPGDLNLINPKDLPSIDIYSGNNNNNNNAKGSTRISDQQSTQGSYNLNNQENILNLPFQHNQLDTAYQNQIPRPTRRESEQDSSTGENSNSKLPSLRENAGIIPPPPYKTPVNKIQFPSKQSGNQQPIDPQKNASNENIHLNQIINEAGFMPDAHDDGGSYNYGHPSEEDRQPQRESNLFNNGGVTVVSARTPIRGEQTQALTVLPSTTNRLYPSNQNKYQSQHNNNNNNRLIPPHLSYSQRIETTSTPLQVPPPSASLRAAAIIANIGEGNHHSNSSSGGGGGGSGGVGGGIARSMNHNNNNHNNNHNLRDGSTDV